MMLSTQFWSFKSNSYLTNIVCAAGVKRGGGEAVRKNRRREEKKARGLGREGRERSL